MAIIPSFYLDAVVSIGIRDNAKTVWIGTGFFVVRKINNNGDGRPFLVTNRHVLLNTDMIVIRMKEKDSERVKEIDAPLLENGKPLYMLHSNPKVDIAVLPLNGSFIQKNNLEFPCFDIDENAMISSELLEKGIDEGSLVYMLGFPMGLVNISSNLPICRLGCVARLSAEQIAESYNLLVDIQNFPGNSGSPIITRPEILSIEGTKSLNQSVLMGIVHSYIPYKESLINSQTKEIVEIRSENSGLANVHPVEYILELIDSIQPKIETVLNSSNEQQP